MRKFILTIFVFAGAFPATIARAEEPMASCDELAKVQQCCSARSCSGKVLSNRDKHNCGNHDGKSWHAASDGVTPAACQNL